MDFIEMGIHRVSVDALRRVVSVNPYQGGKDKGPMTNIWFGNNIGSLVLPGSVDDIARKISEATNTATEERMAAETARQNQDGIGTE